MLVDNWMNRDESNVLFRVVLTRKLLNVSFEFLISFIVKGLSFKASDPSNLLWIVLGVLRNKSHVTSAFASALSLPF